MWRRINCQVWQTHSIVRKHNEKIINGYYDPMNGLWRYPFHDPFKENQQSNMVAHNQTKHQNAIKHWCQHIKPMALWHPRAYHPTPQQELEYFKTSDPPMPKKIHPDPGNQLWVILNMAKSYRKTNHKVSPIFRNKFRMSPLPTSYSIFFKCNTYRNQGRKKTK